VEHEYTGWPDRLYLIDKAGIIRFKTEAGPFGFDAKKLAAALKSY
jgi:type I thyroxine 5'-deiodinase